jgi:hypothetical protein
MSQIPAPPSLPKPKSLSKNNDAATAEHDALLRRVLRNLDDTVGRAFKKKTRSEFESDFSSEVERYLRESAEAATRVRKLADASKDEATRIAGASLADRLSSLDKHFVHAPADELFATSVIRRTVAAPVIEYKTVSGRERATQVGFVDIECTVGVPDRLKLIGRLPWQLTLPGGLLRSRGDLSSSVSAEVLAGTPEAPVWEIEHINITVWIDVRVRELPLGQLMREVKTLRSYAEEDVVVFVVMKTIDAEAAAWLNAEGFRGFSEEWMNTAGYI